jgi:hypothetical protein
VLPVVEEIKAILSFKFTMARLLTTLLLCMCGILFSQGADAHVPFIEVSDFSQSEPFPIEHPIEKSRAIYGWLQSGTDIDVYTFEIKEQTRLRAFSLVPVCPGYEDFLPAFAVAGPGLTSPEDHLPFSLNEGYGAVVIKNQSPGEKRNTFFEPFTNKNYYRGPSFDQLISTPGTWYVFYWNPAGKSGDYVAVFGFRERFSFRDILRTLINVPKIWLDRELHIDCP